jgi:hypothetical protein
MKGNEINLCNKKLYKIEIPMNKTDYMLNLYLEKLMGLNFIEYNA